MRTLEKPLTQQFLDYLQKEHPNCSVVRINEDESWLYYRIDTARREGYIACARKKSIREDPSRVVFRESRNYRLKR